jgi:hypothetical protein
LESAYTGAQLHDAEFLGGGLERVFAKYQFLHPIAVVTNNTATNKLMWKQFREKHPRIFFHGCVCHTLHLLVKDIVHSLAWLNELAVDCKELVVFFRMFLSLPDQLGNIGLTQSDVKKTTTAVKARSAFVLGDTHGLAYLIDPLYVGARLDISARGDIDQFLSDWFGEETMDDVLLELTHFYRHVRDFEVKAPRQWMLLIERKTSVYNFWCGVTRFPLLQKLALQLFKCARLSSAAERNFSSHAYIHSKLRNRLTPERVSKLVHIFFNAKNIPDEDIERYAVMEDRLRVEEDVEEPNQDSDFVYDEALSITASQCTHKLANLSKSGTFA